MNNKGFSLIELLVVLTIVGIITSIAVPSYENYVIRANRGDAKASLLNIMRLQENYFANEYAYTDDLRGLNLSAVHTSDAGHYQVTARACPGEPLEECILLTANPLGNQVKDGPMTLNTRGERTHNGNNGWPK